MAELTQGRLLDELRALSGRYPTMKMLDPAVGALIFEGTLVIDGEEHHLRLSLPPGYPAVPPEVRELELPGGEVRSPAGAMHRFVDGSICLFAHGNDAQVWRKDRLAVEALDRFIALVRRERERAMADRGRLYRDSQRIFIPEGIAVAMQMPGGTGRLRLRAPGSRRGDRFVDAIVFDGDGPPEFEVSLNQVWKHVLPVEEWVPWVHADFDGRAWTEVGNDRARLSGELRAVLPAAIYQSLAAEEKVVLVRSDPTAAWGCDAVLFRRPLDDLRSLYIGDVVVAGPQDRLFQRVEGVVDQLASLRPVRVVLVGLGSLGGAVAMALARAGIERFVLIDPDILSVDNICRHVCPLHYIGASKVEAIKTLMKFINPAVSAEAIAKHLAWDLPWLGAGQELERLLGEGVPTVLVSTCAVGPTERQLNAVAVQHGTPVVYGAALGAAEHARVFRVLPGETACYECVMLAQERDPERFPRYTEEGAPDEGEAYLDPKLPGLGIDITQIAMLVARLTLQTIARSAGIDIGMSDEVGHHLLWSNRGGWGLCDRGLQVAVRDVPRAEDCPACGNGNRGDQLGEDEVRELEALRSRLRDR